VCGPGHPGGVPGAAMVMPGLVDVHSHVGFAGRRWPGSCAVARLEVRRCWPRCGGAPNGSGRTSVVGGILGGGCLSSVGDLAGLAALDRPAGAAR